MGYELGDAVVRFQSGTEKQHSGRTASKKYKKEVDTVPRLSKKEKRVGVFPASAEHITRFAAAAPTIANKASVRCWIAQGMRDGSVCPEKNTDGRQKRGKRRSKEIISPTLRKPFTGRQIPKTRNILIPKSVGSSDERS